MCIKTFTKQDLDILGYQFVIHENMNFAEYQMSHKGAAGKAFSAHMPIYIAFFGLMWRKNSNLECDDSNRDSGKKN